jgi:hypothetical protein
LRENIEVMRHPKVTKDDWNSILPIPEWYLLIYKANDTNLNSVTNLRWVLNMYFLMKCIRQLLTSKVGPVTKVG